MRTNKEGLDLIMSDEGLKLIGYEDIVGIPTIGYGHTGVGVYVGLAITKAQAEKYLLQDILDFEHSVTKMLGVDVNDNQFSALVSLAYNIGPKNLRDSTLIKKVNLRLYTNAADEFLKWNHAGGIVVEGLTRRREAERTLFLKEPALYWAPS